MMFSKTTYVRSPKLMQAYRKIECQHCGIDDGSVCGAHSNQAVHGKGRSIKASDDQAASLCHVCHHALDQGRSMSRADRERMWNEAHIKTVLTLVERELWPREIPVPNMA